MSEEDQFYDILNQGATGCAACECDSCCEKFPQWDDSLGELFYELEDAERVVQARNVLAHKLHMEDLTTLEHADVKLSVRMISLAISSMESLLMQMRLVLDDVIDQQNEGGASS